MSKSWSTIDYYDAALGEWLDQRVLEVFSLEASAPDRFGFVGVSQASIRLDDVDGAVRAQASDIIGTQVTVRHVLEHRYTDGTVISSAELQRSLRVVRLRFDGRVTTLECEDPTDAKLETLYPSGQWTAEVWRNIYPDHEGMVIPEISGVGVGVECAFLGEIRQRPILGEEPRWRYGVCAIRPGQTLRATTILRAQRVAATYNAIYDNFQDSDGNVLAYPVIVNIDGVDHYCLDFVLDQTQYGTGDAHPIAALVDSVSDSGSGRSRNPAWEVRRLLTWAGISTDTVSFDAAEAYCDAESLYVDYAYRDQRRIDALLEELLLVARATLFTLPDGDVAIQQDTGVVIDASTPCYDLQAGDAGELESVTRSEVPAAVQVKYRPWFLNPESASVNRDGYAGEVIRELGDGTGPDYRLPDLNMVRDWEVADRIADYWANQLALAETARARAQVPIIGGAPVFIGVNDVVGFANTAIYPNVRYWRVTGVETVGNEQTLEMRLYSDAAYAYTPSEKPQEVTAEREPLVSVATWGGAYDPNWDQPYRPKTMVQDAGFLMISNKQTWQRPAPELIGYPYFPIDPAAAMESLDTANEQILRGIRVVAEDGPLLFGRIGIYTSDDANHNYRLFRVNDAEGIPETTHLLTFTGADTTPGWQYFEQGTILVPQGMTTDIFLLISRSDSPPTTFGAQWQYEEKNGTADEEKIWHRTNGQTMSINYIPKSGGNQETNLQTLTDGDEIEAGGQLWTITQILSTTSSNLEVEVAPTTHIPEDEYAFTFRHFPFGVITFERILDYFAGETKYRGLSGMNYGGVNVGDNAFQVNVELQNLRTQSDWDFMAFSQA